MCVVDTVPLLHLQELCFKMSFTFCDIDCSVLYKKPDVMICRGWLEVEDRNGLLMLVYGMLCITLNYTEADGERVRGWGVQADDGEEGHEEAGEEARAQTNR